MWGPALSVAKVNLVFGINKHEKKKVKMGGRAWVKYVTRGVSYHFAPSCMLCATFIFAFLSSFTFFFFLLSTYIMIHIFIKKKSLLISKKDELTLVDINDNN